jgi:hypothetical protein
MPLLNSYADVIRDWESLLSSCRKNAELLSGMDSVVGPLDQILLRMKDLKSQQEQLEGTRRMTTQQLQQLRYEGYEAARRVRSFVRSQLGTKNEHLGQFKVAPIRRKPRLTKPEIPAEEVTPKATEPS